MPIPIIQAHNLSLSIESETIMNNISFPIQNGECTVLTVSSGSGKTILESIQWNVFYLTGI
jgi:ABC-type cobalamin/Fe3+-siderophores transport system ATPase subunit